MSDWDPSLRSSSTFEAQLDRAPFYGRLPAAARAALARSSHVHLLAPGEPVLPAAPLRGGLLIDGVVRVYLASPGGREVTFRYQAAPAEFGLMALATLMSGEALPTGVKAVTSCEFVSFDLSPVRAALEADPGPGATLSKALADRLVVALNALALGVFGSVRVRVARHLLDLAVVPTADGLLAPVTQQTLADGAGTVREVVTRALAEFRELGWIATRRGGVLVLDAAALERAARAELEEP